MNHPNLKKKFQCYYEKLLLSKTVQLVTFISRIMLHVNSRETTFEHQRVPAARFNNIFLKLFDRHATYCYSYDVGALSNSQKKAIIILLEKKIKIKETYLTGDQYL